MDIHERIKARRKELRLTAEEVAEAIGVSRATYYRYESNEVEKMPTTILEPLAKVLETTPEYLMGWEDDPVDYERLGYNLAIPNYFRPDLDSGDRVKAYIDFEKAQEQDHRDGIDNYYGNHEANLAYFADKPELLALYKQIHDSHSLQLLFDSAKDLTPQDLEMVLTIIRGIRKERGLD